MTVAFSGLFRELMMTKPKPSFSLRLITTSLVCREDPSGGEVATGAATTGGPEAEAASLRGELCCVDTEPGLRPFTGHGSPEGEDESRRDESAHGGHWVFTVSRQKQLKMKDVATDKNENNSGLLQSQQGFCVKVKLGFSACHLWLFCNRLPLREKRTQKDTNHRACCCRADNEQRINVCMIYYHRKDVWVRSTQRSCAQTVSMCAVSKLCFFNLMPVKCAACSPILVKCEKKDKNTKQKRTEKKKINKQNMSSPGICTLLLTVKLTWPLRAAACIKSITYLCGFPATTFLSTEMSSSPGRSRPSRSAGVFSIIAPMTICSKTINISSIDLGEGDESKTSGNTQQLLYLACKLPLGHGNSFSPSLYPYVTFFLCHRLHAVVQRGQVSKALLQYGRHWAVRGSAKCEKATCVQVCVCVWRLFW